MNSVNDFFISPNKPKLDCYICNYYYQINSCHHRVLYWFHNSHFNFDTDEYQQDDTHPYRFDPKPSLTF